MCRRLLEKSLMMMKPAWAELNNRDEIFNNCVESKLSKCQQCQLCKQCKPCQQCQQCQLCQQCKQFLARCYLHLWWYFLQWGHEKKSTSTKEETALIFIYLKNNEYTALCSAPSKVVRVTSRHAQSGTGLSSPDPSLLLLMHTKSHSAQSHCGSFEGILSFCELYRSLWTAMKRM